MNLCKDCKHYVTGDTCGRTFVPDYVTGEASYTPCRTERGLSTSGHCGAEAVFFEEREPV